MSQRWFRMRFEVKIVEVNDLGVPVGPRLSTRQQCDLGPLSGLAEATEVLGRFDALAKDLRYRPGGAT